MKEKILEVKNLEVSFQRPMPESHMTVEELILICIKEKLLRL